MFYQITLISGDRILARRNIRADLPFAEKIAARLQAIYHAEKTSIEPITDRATLAKFTAQIAALMVLLMVSFTGQIFDDQSARTPRPSSRTTRTRTRNEI